jgi:hypothetical protein
MLIAFTGNAFFLFALTQLLGPASLPPADETERIRAFTRALEFDYVEWTLDALQVKLDQFSLSLPRYLGREDQSEAVLEYLELVRQIQQAEAELGDIYADPNIEEPDSAAAEVREHLEEFYGEREQLGPLAESVLQSQVSQTAAELGFTAGGQPLPPVLYRSTPLPWALIVSPRGVIQQDANISLQTELNVEDHVAVENQIEERLDVSTLVVPVGGVGVYPTMVAQTTDIVWLTEVISHEWIHNYLTLRPLGWNYNDSSELRTMNETAASIAGKEIGRAILARFYPAYLPPPPPPPEGDGAEAQPGAPPAPPAFDFRAEMHETRVTADALLAAGKIAEAEAYMEARRQFFWDNGYRIRRLNQAYFAFYGAYADQPGGAAGEDPVGEAVRALWARSDSLIAFIDIMARFTSFEQLEDYLAGL